MDVLKRCGPPTYQTQPDKLYVKGQGSVRQTNLSIGSTTSVHGGSSTQFNLWGVEFLKSRRAITDTKVFSRIRCGRG